MRGDFIKSLDEQKKEHILKVKVKFKVLRTLCKILFNEPNRYAAECELINFAKWAELTRFVKPNNTSMCWMSVDASYGIRPEKQLLVVYSLRCSNDKTRTQKRNWNVRHSYLWQWDEMLLAPNRKQKNFSTKNQDRRCCVHTIFLIYVSYQLIATNFMSRSVLWQMYRTKLPCRSVRREPAAAAAVHRKFF